MLGEQRIQRTENEQLKCFADELSGQIKPAAFAALRERTESLGLRFTEN